MAWGAVAGAVIGGAVSLAGSKKQAGAASDAAGAQVQATEAQIEESRRQYDLSREDALKQYDTARADQAPYRTAGLTSLERLQYMMGTSLGNTSPQDAAGDGAYASFLHKFDQRDLNNDPVYQNGLQFGMDQGVAGINARAIAGGGYDSGATLKALTRYGNDYGSTKAGGAFDRYNMQQNQFYNRLAGITGTGQTATNSTQQAGAQAGSQIANAGATASGNINEAIAGAGNARAAGIVSGGNAWGNAASGVNNAFNNYSANKRLEALWGGGGSSYGDLYGASGGTSDPRYG